MIIVRRTVILCLLCIIGCGESDTDSDRPAEVADIRVQNTSDIGSDSDVRGLDSAAISDVEADELCPKGTLSIQPSAPFTFDALQAVLVPPQDGVIYSWHSLEGNESTPLHAGFSLPSTLTEKNRTYEARVASTKSADCPVMSVSVTVRNSLPEISQVVVTPSAAYADDTLSCAPLPAGVNDADGDDVSLNYDWLVNGGVVSGQTQSSLSGIFEAGDRVECRVTPFDDDEMGPPTLSPEVLILDEPPVTSAVNVSCDTVDEVICTAVGIDPEGEPLTFRYEWHIGTADCEDAPYFTSVGSGSEGSVLEDTPVKGVNVTCCATAIDPSGLESSPVSSLACTIPNHPPESPGADVAGTASDGIVTVTTPVFCDATVSDVDGDPVTKACLWFIDGSAVAQDSPSCVLNDGFMKGQSLCCQIIANDGTAETTVPSKTCIDVSDSAPTIDSVTLLPENGDHCVLPQCSATGSDADGEEVTVNIAWLSNGQPIAEPDNTTGELLTCVATPIAAGVAGLSVATDLGFSNQVPELASVDISASDTPPVTTSFISCQVQGASDPDECDSVSESTTWVVNNEEVATGPILDSSLFSKGDTVACMGTVSDGHDSAGPMLSDVLVIGDSPGGVIAVTVSPPMGNHKSIFSCNADTYDADGDEVSLTYSWYVDGVLIADKVGPTVSGVPVSQNPTLLTCAISVFGSTGLLPPVPSVNSAALTNALPVVTAVAIAPQVPTTSDTLLCSASGSDADGDPVLFTYEWVIEAGGTLVIVETDDVGTLSPAETTLGQVIRCRATPTDGLFDGIPLTSLPVTIANSPPTSSGALISPAGGTPSTEFICTGTGFYDPDGAPSAFQYEWFLNGLEVAGATTAVWTPATALASIGDTVVCNATPFDGVTLGETQQSNPVVLSACAGDEELPCNDGNACTEDDQCVGGTCVGIAVDCNDGNPCTTDSCDLETGCKYLANTSHCDDGNPCTDNDTCSDSTCIGTSVNCDDDNPCTSSGCSPDVGCVQYAVEGACDDGDQCTVDDYCSAGSCQGGPAAPCDDANPCTTDFCSLNQGCTSVDNNGAPCEDGNSCTAQDTCSGGQCVSGVVTSCDDGNECTSDTCSEATGCTYGPVPIGKACDDADPCTVGEQCEGALCTAGITVICDDGNECTADQCISGSGCTYIDTTGDCLDGTGVCISGACCVPECGEAVCGSDGCGGTCGQCALNQLCTDGQCIDGGIENMALVPAGDFLMGCNPDIELECLDDEMPQRTVTLDAYLIDLYETTVGEYAACVDAAGCSDAFDGFKCTIDDGNADKPVNCVSWAQADEYCAWSGKRLCTEAEWEKAARGVEGHQWPWGEEPVATCLHACLNDGTVGCGSGTVFPVGLFYNAVSPYGLFDAVGNVREWTADYYMANYYQVGPNVNPVGVPFGLFKVARGGGFGDLAQKARPSARDPMSPSSQPDQVGIRCCADYNQ